MRKFQNCDVIAVLGELMQQHTICFQSEIAVKKQLFAEAVAAPDRKDRRFLCLFNPIGTLCVSEYDAYLKHSHAHLDWVYYGENADEDETLIAYAVELKERRDDTVFGDLYELDYRTHYKQVLHDALPISRVNIEYQDGNTVSVDFNSARRGNINAKAIRTITPLPDDIEAWNNLLKNAEMERQETHYYSWDLDKLRLEYGEDPTYEIYQLKPSEHEFLFESYGHLERKGLRPNIERYELTYIAEDRAENTLDEIYERFNIDRPKDFQGHSLSVSDVIVKFDGEQHAAYYVDSCGFRFLPYFFDSATNKNMEM